MGNLHLKLKKHGELNLPRGHVETLPDLFGDKVTWRTDDPKIQGFKIVSKPTNTKYPFREELPKQFGKFVKLTLADVDYDYDWHYDIQWRNDKGKDFALDPKIAVRPMRQAYLMLGALALISLSGIFLYRSFIKKRAANKQASNDESYPDF